MLRCKKRFYCRSRAAVAAMALAALAAAQPPPPAPPPAEQIKAQLIANFQRDQTALEAYTHHEHVVTMKDGERDARTLRVWYVHGHEVNETIALDQRKLSAAELSAEHQRALKRAEEAAQRPPAKTGVLVFGGHEYPFAKLANDFVYGKAEVRQWNGRTIWVYPATPNPHAEGRSREETLLLHTAGEVWVDAADRHVIRVSVRLTSPARYGLGVLATVHAAALDLVLDQHAPGVWLPAETDFSLQATVLFFKDITRAKHTTYSDYQPLQSDQRGEAGGATLLGLGMPGDAPGAGVPPGSKLFVGVAPVRRLGSWA